MPAEIFVFCDGGLANRIGSYISGIALAHLTARPAIVIWPINNRCGARFDQLFVAEHVVLPNRLDDFAPSLRRLQVVAHEQLPVGRANDVFTRTVSDLDDLQRQLAVERPLLFAENQIPPWIPQSLTDSILATLSFVPTVTDRARSVLAQQGAQGYYGIHLRGTDFIPSPPVEQMLALVTANPATRFFVCSDDPAIEGRFTSFNNVFLHPKDRHVDKLITAQGWRSDVRDSDGLPYSSNIDRNADSVILACTDLLLLGASTMIVKTSHSSFLALAERMRRSGLITRQLHD